MRVCRRGGERGRGGTRGEGVGAHTSGDSSQTLAEVGHCACGQLMQLNHGGSDGDHKHIHGTPREDELHPRGAPVLFVQAGVCVCVCVGNRVECGVKQRKVGVWAGVWA